MYAFQKWSLKGFTLIELLIVVAIIAILAAIAVPNFLEAQVRAKVSRAKADMRSLATAIESYQVDNNEYPAAALENNMIEFPRPYTLEPFETRLPYLLTSPISYMTSLVNEPFPASTEAGNENPQYHYATRQYFIDFDLDQGGTGDDQELDDYLLMLLNRDISSLEYFVLSHGPDRDHDEPDAGTPALYDPSNGTTSSGDILYMGPGTGFRN